MRIVDAKRGYVRRGERLLSLNVARMEGRVSSGRGEGTKFIRLPWVREQIAEKLGFTPYPGTLNIVLTGDSVKLDKMQKETASIEVVPPKGFCAGKCVKARLNDSVECAIIVPEVPGYPENIIELIAPTYLRRKLNLKDGDVVQVNME